MNGMMPAHGPAEARLQRIGLGVQLVAVEGHAGLEAQAVTCGQTAGQQAIFFALGQQRIPERRRPRRPAGRARSRPHRCSRCAQQASERRPLGPLHAVRVATASRSVSVNRWRICFGLGPLESPACRSRPRRRSGSRRSRRSGPGARPGLWRDCRR